MFDVALRYVRPLSIPSLEVDNDGSLTVLYRSCFRSSKLANRRSCVETMS